MKRPITRWQWIRLAGGLLLSAVVAAGFRWWPPGLPPDAAFEALQVEDTGLKAYDDATRIRLATERDGLAGRVVPVPLAELKDRLGPDWSWQAVDRDRWRVSLSGTRPDGWTKLLADIAELERRSGVFIEEVELHGDGRAFTRAQVTLRVRSQGRETQPGLEPRPGTVSGREVPAKAPGVGRVRSLRRPGPSVASAHSPGRPWLAPFRPDTRRGPFLVDIIA